MPTLIVLDHALKHGLTERQIAHAWNNAVAYVKIERDQWLDYVAIGPDQNGRLLELTGRKKPFGIVIYHANTPPSKRALRELRLQKKRKGRNWTLS